MQKKILSVMYQIGSSIDLLVLPITQDNEPTKRYKILRIKP